MNKAYYLALALAIAPVCGYAQQPTEPQGQPAEQGRQKPQTRPSTFDQVDKIRKELGLDQKQFDKVYSAYAKYNKAVYGSEPFQGGGSGQRGGMGGPGGGMGGPGGGMGGPGGGMGGPGGGMGGPGGGMGGPGGGMGGPGGGMGGFGGDMGGGRPDGMSQSDKTNAPKQLTEKDMEKRRKKMEKQEQKLEKSVRKALGSDELFAQWQSIHEKEKPHQGPAEPPRPFEQSESQPAEQPTTPAAN